MASRAAMVCLLAAALSAGCNRTEAPAGSAVSLSEKPTEPTGDHPRGDRLAKPVPVEVDGKPLVSERGGLYPFVGDFYGDGRLALLLGYGGDNLFEEGRLLVYRNVGTKVRWSAGATGRGRTGPSRAAVTSASAASTGREGSASSTAGPNTHKALGVKR
jgi:hypothetical protein